MGAGLTGRRKHRSRIRPAMPLSPKPVPDIRTILRMAHGILLSGTFPENGHPNPQGELCRFPRSRHLRTYRILLRPAPPCRQRPQKRHLASSKCLDSQRRRHLRRLSGNRHVPVVHPISGCAVSGESLFGPVFGCEE